MRVGPEWLLRACTRELQSPSLGWSWSYSSFSGSLRQRPLYKRRLNDPKQTPNLNLSAACSQSSQSPALPTYSPTPINISAIRVCCFARGKIYNICGNSRAHCLYLSLSPTTTPYGLESKFSGKRVGDLMDVKHVLSRSNVCCFPMMRKRSHCLKIYIRHYAIE